ncbi:MAG: PilZ domain-containing protein [Bacteriovoracaceae bacterium]|nr:PilZ domain-containing protein [Bacteriovoracaceae bacterium]
MTQLPRTHFTSLGDAEKKSKLWQLSSQNGSCTLWSKGDKEKQLYRVKDYNRDEGRLLFHDEHVTFPIGKEILGTFELNGVSFFFKGKVTTSSSDGVSVSTSGEFYKSERRQNFRLLTYPIYDISAEFKLPESYAGGKVIDFRQKISQTGLFKSFLRIVDPGSENQELGSLVKMRVQDLSVTGLSIHIGSAELDWFKAGTEIKELVLNISSDVIVIPKSKIVYVIDHIGHADRFHKKYKIGLRFEDLPSQIDQKLGSKINELLRSVDANKEFEDFLK